MKRLIIVSNRLPMSIERSQAGTLAFKRSIGGVATGLSAFHETHESKWVGWADVPLDQMSAEDVESVREALAEEYDCEPVFLSEEDVEGFYHGFSNRTIWPLFHHFTQYAEFDSEMWDAYERVNRAYCEAVLEVARPGDTIWIQDYQLMLLPAMLREAMPDATIGWFLHIPFPSFEIFRMLPWRREILEGLLGSDLIGFHTYDYARYFLSSCRRLLGTEDQFGRIVVDDRLVLVDAFPMGIDYDRYRDGARTDEAIAEVERIGLRTSGRKVVLSIDRLDYTKGIPERLRAFDAFLDAHPEWLNKVTMVCVAVPSREGVETYRLLKAEVDELVGSINGRHGTIDWTPIRYLYRSLPFHTLSGMYGASDVSLVTPLRDGMNLIAKEYLAACDGGLGVLVLSEMAGAARELGEALQVNPFDRDAIVEALRTRPHDARGRATRTQCLDDATAQALRHPSMGAGLPRQSGTDQAHAGRLRRVPARRLAARASGRRVFERREAPDPARLRRHAHAVREPARGRSAQSRRSASCSKRSAPTNATKSSSYPGATVQRSTSGSARCPWSWLPSTACGSRVTVVSG